MSTAVQTLPKTLRYGISLFTKLDANAWSFGNAQLQITCKTPKASAQTATEEQKILFEQKIAKCQSYNPQKIFDAVNKEQSIQTTTIVVEKNATEQLVHVTLPEKGTIARIYFHVKENATATLVFDASQSTPSNVVLHAIVENNAKLTCFTHLHTKAPTYVQTTSTVAEHANVTWNTVNTGHEQLFSNIINILEHPEATADIYSGIVHDNADVFYATVHDQKQTSSNMVIKGITGENSRLIQRGLVKINKQGADCDGYQQTHIIKLHERGQAHALPQLEIDNNDVKCSHGATISTLQHDQLFYLMSRGLSESESKHLLVEGFIYDIATRVTDLGWDKQLSRAAHNMLN